MSDLSTSGGAITVRRAAPADADAFVRLMSHDDVYPSLMQLPWCSPDMWRARLEKVPEFDSADIHLVAELDGTMVGSAGLHPVPRVRRRHVAVLGISVLPDAQRRGVGSALMQALCGYADGWAQILRTELTVFADNHRAIALYGRFGFRHEGTHRAYALRGGVYADVLSMARLHPRPPVAAWD